jgi:hypothetical protein
MILGPITGGAIKIDRHSSVSNVLAIGEGVETCLAGRHYGYSPAWAMISDKGDRVVSFGAGRRAPSDLWRRRRRRQARVYGM